MSNYRRRLLLANQTEENLYLYGNSVQDGTPSPDAPIDIVSVENPTIKVMGNNIIPNTYYNPSGTVSNGVTYTINDNGSVTANGTALSNNSVFYFTIWTNEPALNDWFEDGETYVMSGNNTTDVQIILQGKRLNDNKDIYYYGNGKPFTIDKSTYKYCHLRIQVKTNITVDNVTVYPMINKGATALPYEPYYEENITMDEIHIPFGNNLFNFNLDIIKKGYPDFGEATLIEKTENGIIAQGKVATTGAPGMSSWYNGWFQPHLTKTTNGAYIKNGDTVTISADYTWLDIANYDKTSPFYIHLCTQNNTGNNIGKDIGKIPTEEDIGKTYRVSVTHTNTKKDGYFIPIFTLNSCKIKIENIQIAYNKNTTYESYTPPTFRGIKNYRDKIYTKDGKVWYEKCIHYSKPTKSSKSGPDGRQVIDKLPHPNNYIIYPEKKSNFGGYSMSYDITTKLHWYLAKTDSSYSQIWLIPSSEYSNLWTSASEAYKHLTETLGIYPEFQYPLATPIVTEITGSLAEKILAIDKTKNIYFISENGIQGETEVIEE